MIEWGEKRLKHGLSLERATWDQAENGLLQTTLPNGIVCTTAPEDVFLVEHLLSNRKLSLLPSDRFYADRNHRRTYEISIGGERYFVKRHRDGISLAKEFEAAHALSAPVTFSGSFPIEIIGERPILLAQVPTNRKGRFTSFIVFEANPPFGEPLIPQWILSHRDLFMGEYQQVRDKMRTIPDVELDFKSYADVKSLVWYDLIKLLHSTRDLLGGYKDGDKPNNIRIGIQPGKIQVFRFDRERMQKVQGGRAEVIADLEEIRQMLHSGEDWFVQYPSRIASPELQAAYKILMDRELSLLLEGMM